VFINLLKKINILSIFQKPDKDHIPLKHTSLYFPFILWSFVTGIEIYV